MVGRFRHVAAVLTVGALVAGPDALSVAATAPTAVDGPTTARIGLAGADPDGLQQFAAAVSDPHDAQYRHFLTPAQAQARFGPTTAQLAKVHAWLAGGGLKVSAENSHWIDVAGTAGEIRKAFGQLPERRSHAVGGYVSRAGAAVPAELVGAVSSVAGLVPEPRGMRQFSYRVAAGPRSRVLTGPGVDPGGPMQPAGPVDSSGPAEPTIPGAGVNPGGPMQPSGPVSPVIVGGPIKRSLPTDPTDPGAPADPGDPTAPATDSTACSSDWGGTPATGVPQGYNKPDPLVVCGYSPKQLRAAYGVTASGFTGKGAIIGVVDAYGSPTMRADANQFATSVGDTAFGAGQYMESVDAGGWKHLGDGVCETPAAWGGEEALDVEMAHGLAPGAVVHYFGAASCQDQDIAATLAGIVDKRSADVVTGSFGEIMHATGDGEDADIDPALIAQENQIFTTGAAEGIGFAFASGDCGDQAPGLTGPGCDAGSARAQVEWPAASPWVTAVGGTALALAADGTRHWEVPMGDLRSDLSADGTAWAPLPGTFYFGGGGGTSEDFDQPGYQKGVVPNDLAHTAAGGSTISTAMRTVPDVALDGDLLTAVRTGHTDPTLGGYGQDVVGGTSAAAPMFAAVQADAMQASGGALGFANPALYKRAGTKQLTDIVDHPAGAPATISAVVDHGMFGDTHEARLYKLDADHGLAARKGYDTATGLGSPTAAYITSFKPVKKPVKTPVKKPAKKPVA
ncbi:S8 family serine peptidase [Catenulispora sp. NF23]|uniref:S8 family serine peptidase n=1 Tax=Catenulispora pinistramenti TaxID=2705254 RepID=A0ABS5KY31_9ACTN|nr:S53 family peptidase [Catenulispora pinistramenti]MBS2535848.1 S8 family serine peptidase [Catenulispora pinistramenti]MBS2550860.1 S8 family serine peptidase [Catenulispora pinistramenti]